MIILHANYFNKLLMLLPRNLYTASQVRELDRIAIEDFAISGFSLMQRAGQVTFDSMMKSYPKTQSVCVVCGTGNNGGDGYVIATLAVNAALKVTLIQLGEDAFIRDDALQAREDYLKTGARVLHFSAETQKNLNADIIVDAIFGTGLTRNVEGDWAEAITAINRIRSRRKSKNSVKVVAVDVPSGLHSDTGAVLSCAVKADKTVTYIGLKCGLLTGQARDYVGDLEFDDLGVPFEVYKHVSAYGSKKQLITDNVIQESLKPRSRCSHKGHFGHVLCIGGGEGMSGAIRLTAEAALRAGAGLVSIATHPVHANCLNSQRPEIMVSGIERAEHLLPLMEKADVIIIGPGLGTSKWAHQLLSLVLATDKPKVLDADALNLLAEHHFLSKANLSPVITHTPFENEQRHDNWVLTPHPAEAARLLITRTDLIEQDRYQSAELLQQQFGGICVLKGAGSIIADGKKTRVCRTGNPGMASGGMGDLLTGIIGSLLAQNEPSASRESSTSNREPSTSSKESSASDNKASLGLSLSDVASLGVFIHGKAADLAIQQGGERGLLASDLLPFIRILVNPDE